MSEKNRFRKPALYVGAATVIALATSAVAAPTGTLIIADNEWPPGVDCIFAGVDSVVDQLCMPMYDTLYQYPAGSSELQPQLATGADVSADGLTYTIKLREGVKFHDGAPLTAKDVKYTLDRIKGLNVGNAV